MVVTESCHSRRSAIIDIFPTSNEKHPNQVVHSAHARVKSLSQRTVFMRD